MKVVDSKTLGDDELWPRAVTVLDQFVSQHECPVTTTQIRSLERVATYQPNQVSAFARHQKQREEAKQGKGAAFWEFICGLHGEPADHPCLLFELAKTRMPPEWEVLLSRTKSELSIEERQQRNSVIKQRKQHIDEWNEWATPLFYQHFCSHYLFLKSLPPATLSRHLEESRK